MQGQKGEKAEKGLVSHIGQVRRHVPRPIRHDANDKRKGRAIRDVDLDVIIRIISRRFKSDDVASSPFLRSGNFLLLDFLPLFLRVFV